MAKLSKIVSLQALAARIGDETSVALGGSFLHRGSFAAVRELARQRRQRLEIIKASPGYDLDLLCRARAVAKVRAGIVALEGNFGLAPHYRRAIERKEAVLEEHACMTLVSGMRAAAFGVPFLPIAGVDGSDLATLNGWKKLADPYGSGKEVYLIPAIRPDAAIIHVHEADELGNARIYGTPFWDQVLTRAARRVLITCERLVSTDEIQRRPELTLVPGFMVEAVAVIPKGAWPGSMAPDYEVDYPAMENYLAQDADALQRHLAAAPEAAGAKPDRPTVHA